MAKIQPPKNPTPNLRDCNCGNRAQSNYVTHLHHCPYRLQCEGRTIPGEKPVTQDDGLIEPAPPPRIICTKCPAVATVHYVYETLQSERSSTRADVIWLECHGRHLWAEAGYRNGPRPFWEKDNGSFALFEEIAQKECSSDHLVEWMNTMLGGRERIDGTVGKIFEYFDKANISDGAYHRFFEIADRQIQFWGTLAQHLQEKLKK